MQFPRHSGHRSCRSPVRSCWNDLIPNSEAHTKMRSLTSQRLQPHGAMTLKTILSMSSSSSVSCSFGNSSSQNRSTGSTSGCTSLSSRTISCTVTSLPIIIKMLTLPTDSLPGVSNLVKGKSSATTIQLFNYV